MEQRKYRLANKSIFLAAYCVLLVSRILVLTDSYTWRIDPVELELVYLVATVFLALTSRYGKFRMARGVHWFVFGALLAHTLLWGVVFVDARFANLITSQFKSQIMFVVITIVTVLAVYQFDVAREFLKCCYYTLAAMLIYYFLKNFSQLDLSNLANIMTASERTRANFGFGHYNTLGATCVCGIFLWDVARKDHHTLPMKVMDGAILVVLVCMLLASASRSALTSLVVYYFVYFSWQMDEWSISKKVIRAIKLCRNALIAAMVAWVVLEANYTALLELSQRTLLFTHALPMFFSTDKIWMGLGYASNVAYATRQTPYLTYWLDNAYIYYLITTGIVGCALLMVATFVLGKELYRCTNLPIGKETIAAFAVQLYASLFEVALFNSGLIVNYIYLPWFLIYISRKRKTETS